MVVRLVGVLKKIGNNIPNAIYEITCGLCTNVNFVRTKYAFENISSKKINVTRDDYLCQTKRLLMANGATKISRLLLHAY